MQRSLFLLAVDLKKNPSRLVGRAQHILTIVVSEVSANRYK